MGTDRIPDIDRPRFKSKGADAWGRANDRRKIWGPAHRCADCPAERGAGIQPPQFARCVDGGRVVRGQEKAKINTTQQPLCGILFYMAKQIKFGDYRNFVANLLRSAIGSLWSMTMKTGK